MIRFIVCKEFSADPQRVWEVVSDVSRVPEFWRGTRELRVKETQRDVFEGEIRFAFPAKGLIRITRDPVRRSMTFQYLKGPVKGTNEVTVNESELCSEWSVSLSFPYSVLEKRIAGHFRKGTENALERVIATASRT